MKKVLRLTKSQTIFFTDHESKAIAFVTGFGGGKTFSLVTKLVNQIEDNPKVDFLYLMPVFSMFRDVLFPTLIEILDGTGFTYKISKTTGEIFFPNGCRVILKSMENPDTIVGMNVLDVFLDELDTLSKDKAKQVWIKAIARARKAVPIKDENGEPIIKENGKPLLKINQLNVGTTPEGFRFVYDMFEKNRPDNYTLIQASGYENEHLPEDYYDTLKAVYSDELVEAYINGKFVNMAVGSVYKDFDRESCDSDAIYRVGEELHISMDFNVMNMNGVVFVPRGPVFTGDPLFKYEGAASLHAIRHLKEINDTPEMIEVIKNRYPTSPIHVYPDASGKNTSSKGFTTSDISMLKAAGFHVHAPSKNPRIMDRVQSVNTSFRLGYIKVNVTACPDVAEALEIQVFNANTELPEKTATSSVDDINDSFGYMIHYKFKIDRSVITHSKVGGM